MDREIIAYRSTTLFAIMAANGQPLSWLARKTGVSRSLVSKISKGQRRATRGWAERAAEAVNLPVDALFFEPVYADADMIAAPVEQSRAA